PHSSASPGNLGHITPSLKPSLASGPFTTRWSISWLPAARSRSSSYTSSDNSWTRTYAPRPARGTRGPASIMAQHGTVGDQRYTEAHPPYLPWRVAVEQNPDSDERGNEHER